MAFVKALKSIHKGGFLHGNIVNHNLIIRSNVKLEPEENQGVVIVGLGDALREPSNKEMADEHKRLMWLLPDMARPAKRSRAH
jgi:hypothetical protein